MAITAFVVIGWCVFVPMFEIAYSRFYFGLWMENISPKPEYIESNKPKLINIINEDYYRKISWSEDGSLILLYFPDDNNKEITNWVVVDPITEEIIESNSTSNDIRSINQDEEISFTAKCNSSQYHIYGEELENNQWVIHLMDESQLIEEFKLDSLQWSKPKGHPFLHPTGFSPDCTKLLFRFHGWTSHEYEGDEEIWLLYIETRKLTHLLNGRNIHGFAQNVRPSWSPEGERIVFGDMYYGLETYDLTTDERSMLLGPDLAQWYPEWSKTGNLIVSVSDPGFDNETSLVIVDKNSTYYTETTMNECGGLNNISWSPVSDTLVFSCRDYETQNVDVWIWDLSQLSIH